MPYLQLDVNGRHEVADKKRLARKLGLREDRLNVEFTQHSGDEMYHPTLGGYSPEWSEDETHLKA